jgi:two-component system, response regulator PdtaR
MGQNGEKPTMAEEARPRRHAATNAARTNSGTVLVVEPDPVLRQAVCTVLERSGYQVLAQGEETEEALPLARKLEPSVLVLGQSGTGSALLDSTRAIRSTDLSAIVLLSPIPDLKWVRAAAAAGVDILLGRPPREADLVAAVELSLARRHEVRHIQTELKALKERLETGALVQRAKIVLMRRDGITDNEAYQRLRKQAERSGRPLRSIAEAVLLAASVTPVE